MRLTVLLVDDEPLARQGLRRLLRNDPQVDVILEARNGREAVQIIRDRQPDLVLLDVQMPRMDGFAVVEAIGPAVMPAVIFVTAHDQYAVRAFEISAIDYLLKPVTAERFRAAFDRATSRLQGAPTNDASRQILAMLDVVAKPPRYPARLAVRVGEKTVFVVVEDVDRIEALQNYVRLHVGQTRHLLHVPLSTIETALDPARFMRIHRSQIVNLRRIRQVWPLAHSQYVVELVSGERLQSGRTYGERIRRMLSNPF